MTVDEFRRSLDRTAPPDGLSVALAALWWAGKDDWRRAHELAQEDPGADAAWVHAYLHRVEGDLGNAGYWYRRAGRPAGSAPLEDEWRAIATALLAR